MRKIAVIGENKEDLIIYLSSILKNLEKQVAVIEKGIHGKYLEYLGENNIIAKGIITKNNVDYCVDGSSNLEDSTGFYDVVFINFNELNNDKIFECDELMVVATQNKKIIEGFDSFISENYEKLKFIHFINKDIVECKTIPSEIIKKVKIDEESKVLETYNLYLDEQNIKNKLDLQYSNRVKLSKLSSEYKKCIINIIKYMFTDEEERITEKEIKLAFKKSKKGI